MRYPAEKISVIVITLSILSANAASTNKKGVLFSTLEWSLANPSVPGNPFDIIASATFTHAESGEKKKTGLFYAGSSTWKFRFTGTRTGTWTYVTASGDADLDGHEGSVLIEPNPDPEARGFVTLEKHAGLAKQSNAATITGSGNKWARRKSGGTLETFIPHYRMIFEKKGFNWSSSEIDGRLKTWMDDEGFNGVQVLMAGYWVNRDGDSKFENKDPDTRSFDVLESIIKKVQAKGGVVHIWYNGDCKRKQCVKNGFGSTGAKSEGEKKLLRYIGSRLGPLPGWIMGYGYDNPEHVNTAGLRGWGNYLRENMADPHMLGARDQGKNIKYTYWPEADFYSRGDWFNGASYNDLVKALNTNTSKPHSFDERWWISRLGTEEKIRRQMWNCNMAGGISGIFGNKGDWEKDPYSNPHWFKTSFTFWRSRFLSSMAPDNEKTNGYCLMTSDRKQAVFYRENASSIQLDLSKFSGSLTAVAVDAKKKYAEIPVTLTRTNQTWTAPSSSDWAIAVGFQDPSSVRIGSAGQAWESTATISLRSIGNVVQASSAKAGIASMRITTASGALAAHRDFAGTFSAVMETPAGLAKGIYHAHVAGMDGSSRTITIVRQ